MGKKIYPLYQEAGGDVDYEWQIPQTEYWLRKHGFTGTITPYYKTTENTEDTENE